MQTDIVKVKDLIEQSPADYKFWAVCQVCGGNVYSAHDVAWECENVIFKYGKVWEDSPCNFLLMGG